MSVGIVEHSILQYVLQYGFAVLQYIAIRFLPYCGTPINVRQEKVNFVFLRRLHLLNKCWQVSKGKIKLYINESRYILFEEPFKTFYIII